MPRYTRTKENLESHVSPKRFSQSDIRRPDQKIRKQQKKVCKGLDSWHESHEWSMPYFYGRLGDRNNYYTTSNLSKSYSIQHGTQQSCVRCGAIKSYLNSPTFWRGAGLINKQWKAYFDIFDKDIFEFYRAQDQEFTEEYIFQDSKKHRQYFYLRNRWQRICKKREKPIIILEWGKSFIKKYNPEWKNTIEFNKLVNEPKKKQ